MNKTDNNDKNSVNRKQIRGCIFRANNIIEGALKSNSQISAQEHKNTGNRRSHCWLRFLFPVTGLLALIWFLVRVIPKPSRATYPCQRVAFPLASSFIIWLIGLIGSVAAFHNAKKYVTKTRYALAAVCIVASVAYIWAAMSNTGQKIIYGQEPPIANAPMGEAKGVYPGRVAWIHDPDATDWAGYGEEERWYSSDCTNQEVVDEMLSKALRALAGRSTDYHAWETIFRNFNQRMGKGDVDYTPGEKIAIKANFTLMHNASGSIMEKHEAYIDLIDNSPQLAIALLKQLTDVVGANPGDISIGDTTRIMPNYWYNIVEEQCPGIVYLTNSGFVGSGRTSVGRDYDAPFYWSDPCEAHWDGVTNQDYIPTYFSRADYFINFPILKTHGSSGITVGGKNHYGSLIRNPADSGYFSMHLSRLEPGESPGMGHYRAIVDLMGHPRLGGKTLLALIDGLYAGISWSSYPVRWGMSPFYDDWPSSIIVSQDQIAADSVAFDFLYYEWYFHAGMSGADDYLHEAALANDPCSGTFYDPNHDGVPLESLGVHEHWNNATSKQYSRNLDPINGTGIELVTSQILNLLTVASQPNPAHRAMGVQSDPVLTWAPGIYADKHDVYLGTDEAKVTDANRTNPLDVLVSENHGVNNFAVTNLDPNTTYYWRIDEVDVPCPDPCDPCNPCLWKGDVWRFTTAPLTAHSPDPPNDAKWLDTDTDLSWGAGFYADTHNVYFGTVNPPPLVFSEWWFTYYDPGPLEANTIYYWRIDEVNNTDIWPGDVWSFTTLDTVAGIKADYYNNTSLLGSPVLTRTDYSIDFDFSYSSPGPNVGDDKSDAWSVKWTAEINVPYTETYNFTTVRSISDGVRLWVDGQLIIENWPGDDDILEDTATIDLVAGLVPIVMEYYDSWGPATAQLSWESPSIPREIIPRDAFFLPLRSVSPNPKNGATDVQSNPILSWAPGGYVDKHDVYFGTDFNSVSDANRTNDPYGVLVSENQDANTYGTGLLEFNTTHYWRIDDVNGPDIWPSSVWSFTTGSYHVVDDFELYEDTNDLKDVWHISGSDLAASTDTLFRQTHESDQAMAYSYDNSSSPYYSKADANTSGPNSLDFGSNLRLQDVKALSLWFQGALDVEGSFIGLDPYTIEADGLGLKGAPYEEDYFYYVYRQVSANTGEVEAMVGSLDAESSSALAGVMLRDTLNQDSKYAALYITAGDKVIFKQRRNDGVTYFTTVYDVTTPRWLRLSRSSSPPPFGSWTAEHAPDDNGSPGTYVTVEGNPPFNAKQLSLSTPIRLGLCVTSGKYGQMCTAEISNVSMECPLGTSIGDPDVGQDIGWASNDPEKMYVVLKDSDNDAAAVYYPGTIDPNYADANATKVNTWTEWRIDLNDFSNAGVDIYDVNKIYIGFGDRSNPTAGGSGMMFIDDIRLYLAEFYEPKCPPWPVDLIRDGDINYADLGAIIDYWLMTPPDPNIDLYVDGTIDFKDIAEIGNVWGQKQVWPIW